MRGAYNRSAGAAAGLAFVTGIAAALGSLSLMLLAGAGTLILLAIAVLSNLQGMWRTIIFVVLAFALTFVVMSFVFQGGR